MSLKRTASGHLGKTASGHLVRGCEVTCPCLLIDGDTGRELVVRIAGVAAYSPDRCWDHKCLDYNADHAMSCLEGGASTTLCSAYGSVARCDQGIGLEIIKPAADYILRVYTGGVYGGNPCRKGWYYEYNFGTTKPTIASIVGLVIAWTGYESGLCTLDPPCDPTASTATIVAT